jgi:tetratricopeptide (TPR) repeat protein
VVAPTPARRRQGRLTRGLLTVALVTFCVSHAGAQRYLDAFTNGIRAIDQQRWAEAARQMEAAAAERPDTGDNTRVYGTRFENYLPNYFLGVALYQMNDFARAIQAFNASEQLGGVKKNAGYYRRLQDLRREAQGKIVVASVTTTAPPATSTVPPAPALTTTSTGLVPVTVPATTTTTTPAPPPPGVNPAALLAAEQAVQRATQQRQTIDALPDLEALRQIDRNLATADRSARDNLDRATARLETGRRGNAADLREAVPLAQAAVAGFQRSAQLAGDAVRRVTGELVAATKPYFSGQYAAAQTALERLNYPSSRFAAQLRLFRAATAYSLYALSGQRDETLRQDAETNIRECRRIAGTGFKPDARAFSPRFAQFFETTR